MMRKPVVKKINGITIKMVEQGSIDTKFEITNRSGKTFHFNFNEDALSSAILVFSRNEIPIHFGCMGEFKVTALHEDLSINEVKSMKGVKE